jgi:hypothetical protein
MGLDALAKGILARVRGEVFLQLFARTRIVAGLLGLEVLGALCLVGQYVGGQSKVLQLDPNANRDPLAALEDDLLATPPPDADVSLTRGSAGGAW